MSHIKVRVGKDGQVILSSTIQILTGIKEGDEIVVRADGRGRVVIETLEAIENHRRGSNPTMLD